MTSIDFMPVIDGFPRPNWKAISEEIQSRAETEWPSAWANWGETWVDLTAQHLPNYKVAKSDNFFVLSSQDDRYVNLLLSFLEKSLHGIMRKLDGIAFDEGFGRHVVLIFDEQETYYSYISYFYPVEGEFILSSGVFLNSEYGHFVFPFVEMYEAEATAAHELTHACLRHLPIPLWLNEGLAVTMEDELCGSQPLRMDKERLMEHRDFWNAKTIQEFWSGVSFNRTDNGSGLSYELARYCLRSLGHEYDHFSAFANHATFEDGGEAAAIEVFGGSLGGLIDQFFGPGDWSPKPDVWNVPGTS